MNSEFAYRSNKYAKGEARWCENHPTGYWGKNPKTGQWYSRCTRGFKTNTPCKIGKHD